MAALTASQGCTAGGRRSNPRRGRNREDAVALQARQATWVSDRHMFTLRTSLVNVLAQSSVGVNGSETATANDKREGHRFGFQLLKE